MNNQNLVNHLKAKRVKPYWIVFGNVVPIFTFVSDEAKPKYRSANSDLEINSGFTCSHVATGNSKCLERTL
jgi:hypothetical protein